MAPTDVSVLAIPRDTGENLPVMSDQKKTQMRLSPSELKLIIVDEVSMVSNIRLLHRLKDIFCSSSSQLFAGIGIVVVEDLY